MGVLSHTFGDGTITDAWLQVLTYAGHSWALGSEGSLTDNTTCDTVQTFVMVMRTRDTHTCGRAFGSGAVTTCFKDSGMSRPGIEPWSPAWETNALSCVALGNLGRGSFFILFSFWLGITLTVFVFFKQKYKMEIDFFIILF